MCLDITASAKCRSLIACFSCLLLFLPASKAYCALVCGVPWVQTFPLLPIPMGLGHMQLPCVLGRGLSSALPQHCAAQTNLTPCRYCQPLKAEEAV